MTLNLRNSDTKLTVFLQNITCTYISHVRLVKRALARLTPHIPQAVTSASARTKGLRFHSVAYE